MKKVCLIFMVFLLLPVVFAINLQVEKVSTDEVLVIGSGVPTIFDLEITNLGVADNFEFYNLLGFSMFPVGSIPIGEGETKEISLGISPLGRTDERGFYIFDYFIKSSDGSQVKEQITFKITDVEGAFIIGSGEVDPESQEIEIYIKNKESFDFGELDIKFYSAFFEIEKTFTLGPKQIHNFTVKLDNEDFRDLMAGFYTLSADVEFKEETSRVEGVIKFVEKELVTTTKKEFGFFIHTKIIEKKNEGNTVEYSETVIKKNIISRLFTSFNPEPDLVEREGGTVYYTWAREVRPGEKSEILVKTNWLFPLILIILIVAIVVLVRRFSEKDVMLRKKVSFVNAKGGEFALKVSIQVKAKNYVERVNVIDKLPALVKIYERFGGDEPTRVDEKNKKIEWNFEKLEQGEIRIISYVIYSKIGVVGKFALPKATVLFEKEGKIKEAQSNQAFFVAEQRGEKF